ncbi:caspase family protein [Paraflavitalea sp. CAU 1676]|uniref:caspase family protein n=1 Tax=Paraflavitalea sp. CAU 1676 TaxID=3032598 RepID=UPI0023D9A5E7|nr:caspase family protein [Paraflavitalea sp. CAU 1676]MDF2188358.1 caspase family protein [Paraflavitalea sp. CAU 1676]
MLKAYRYLAVYLTLIALYPVNKVQAQDASLFTKDGHLFNVYTMSISPDGKILATVDMANYCVLWDITTGKQFQTITNIRAASFAGSNESMCVVTKDGDVNIISLTGKVIKQVSQKKISFKYRRYCNLYPEDGIHIEGADVFDINKGRLLTLDVQFEQEPVYSPATKQIALSSYFGDSIVLFDLKSRNKVYTIKPESKKFGTTQLSFSADGKLLVVTSSDEVKVLDMNSKKFIRSFQCPTNTSFVRSSAISPDGGTVVSWTRSKDNYREKVSLINIRTGNTIWTKEYAGQQYKADKCFTRFSDDGQKLLLGTYETMYALNTTNGSEISQFVSYRANSFYGNYPSKNSSIMTGLMHSDSAWVFRWNLVTGQLENMTGIAYGKSFFHKGLVEPLPDRRKILAVTGDKLVEVDTAGKLLFTYPASPGLKSITGIDVSYNGQFVLRKNYSEGGPSLEVFDCSTHKKVMTRTGRVGSAVFAHTQNVIALLEGANQEFVRLYELPSGKLLQQTKVQAEAHNLLYAPNDVYLTLFTSGASSLSPNDDKATVIDVKKNTVTHYDHPKAPNNEWALSRVDFSPDARYLIFKEDGDLVYLDLQQKKFAKTVALSKIPGASFFDISFSNDGKLAFLGGRHATITVVDLETPKIVARMYPDIYRKDWAVVTPDGRFDGNTGALEGMYHAKGNAIVPLSAMYEKFYTPRLLARLLAGETFEPVNVDVNDLKKTPQLTMEFKENSRNLVVEDDIKTISSKSASATITVNASCPQDAVTEIRLYQNGKLIETTRNLEVDDDNIANKKLTRSFQINLLPGSNRFRAIAFNSQRTESKPLELMVQYAQEKTGPASPTTAAQLHIVVVGINIYKNSRYNLNYAQADAAAFKTALEAGSAGIFAKVNTHYIKDADASKAGIASALEKVKQAAQPQDLFVFYYAGHGVVNDQKEFYLVPSDVTQLYGNDNALAQNGLSAAVLQKFSKEIKAQKQLFILDACQSAGALDNIVAARGAAEEKAIAQLARSTGTHWLTASGSTQFAAEFAQLGHGSFTYCLLEALTGKADNGDKKITVKELDAYLQTRVPEITQQYKGAAQYPASFGYGNDFPLLIVK